MSEKLQQITAAVEADEVSKAVELLGDDQSMIDKGGAFWMTIGAENDNVDMMARLHELGCPVNGKSFRGTPLKAASAAGAIEAVRWLIDKGVTLDSDGSSPSAVESAVVANQVEMVKMLIAAGADIHESIGGAELSLLDVAELHSSNEIASYLQSLGLSRKVTEEAEPGRPASRPLRESECRKIERAIKLKLPKQYRKLLKSLPEGLSYDIGCVDGFIYLPEDIIAETQAARNFKEDEWLEPFPRNLIVIGGNGGGDCICVNADEDGAVVYLFDHENGCISEDERWQLSEFLASASLQASSA